MRRKKLGSKEATVTHRFLEQTDRAIMRAIREHGGFAHVLVYGPSGVGKTTMIRQITKRLNGTIASSRPAHALPASASSSFAPVPVLVLETRPPDGAAFNRADYYRNALVKLGEPFYERRRLIDIHSEQEWEKQARGRGKAAQFNEAPELRTAMEEAMQRHSVRAVILDEAQHLMTVGNGKQGSMLLDQLDWIKSMTNVTDIVHILIGTYDLLSFTHLNGQASRRGLPIHFPRYQLQREEDCLQFQAALLALLQKVPLQTDAETLVVEHWLYFYERCIGCIGILKDWLLRAVSAAPDDEASTLTLDYLHAHALDIAQCEQMALDAIEGEQKLSYNEGRREHLWRLLQGGGDLIALPVLPKNEGERVLPSAPHTSVEQVPASPKDLLVKKTKGRIGQRTPGRDPVGETTREERPAHCHFSGMIDVEPTRLTKADVSKVECPECGAVRTVHIQGNSSIFPSHLKRKTNTTRDEERWIKQGTEWMVYTKGKE